MKQKRREIKAVLHMPESENAVRQFEQRICNFYTTQVEHRLAAMTKEKKLEVLNIMIAQYASEEKSA